MAGLEVPEESLIFLSNACDGDSRVALNALEIASQISSSISIDNLKKALQRTHLLYDKVFF